MLISPEELGEIAYNAYCAKRSWKSVRGEALPAWDKQHKDLQEAWIAAAETIAHKVRNEMVNES